MSQLQINNLYKTYDKKTFALQDISFEVEKNDFIILLGLSGSGKSTLLRCINRLVEPTKGDICYEGKSVIKMDKLNFACIVGTLVWYFSNLIW